MADRKPRSRRIVPLALAAASLAWALTPAAAGQAWFLDLAANLAPWSLFSALFAALIARRRARRVTIAAAAMTAAALAFWLTTYRAPHAGPGGQGQVRVLQLNAYTERSGSEDVIEFLDRAQADVVAITEAPRELLDRLRTDPGLLIAYPFRDLPPWDPTHTRVLLSRWPVEVLIDRPVLEPGDPRRALRLVRVHHPDGPFVALTLQPRSPRTPARWREGNAQLGVAIGAVRDLAPTEPLVVLADLNSTPTGARSRRLCRELGLARAKPPLTSAGTYPAALPWPLSIAIDDVWVSSHRRIGSWSAVPGLGSDHRAVEVTLQRQG